MPHFIVVEYRWTVSIESEEPPPNEVMELALAHIREAVAEVDLTEAFQIGRFNLRSTLTEA